jgi:hypothetical protein
MEQIMPVDGVELDTFGLIGRDSLLDWQKTCTLLEHFAQ